MNIFRIKNVSLDKQRCYRHLKLWDLILLGIGAMVGIGVFTITGPAVAILCWPSPQWFPNRYFWLVCGIITSFAEFGSWVLATGGAYSYLCRYLREFPAWLAGWLTMMEFMVVIPGVASVGQLILKACSHYWIALLRL